MTRPPWDSLWIHAHLATFDRPGAYGEVRDGAIGIVDGRIAWIGRASELTAEPHNLALEVHSARGGWVTPGLIDAHTHLVFGGSRVAEFEQRLAGRSYAEIARAGGGIRSTVRETRAASLETLTETGTRHLRMLAAEGVTTAEVKSGYGLELESELRMLEAARLAAAAADVDVRCTFLGLHALPAEYEDRRADFVRQVTEEWLPAVIAAGPVDAVDAFLEGIAFDAEEVAEFLAAGRDAGLGVRLHADQLTDCEGAALAASLGAWSADHLEYTSEAGVRAMAEAGTIAMILPGAYHVLGETQRPPIQAFREHGVPMAVATDLNPGSSPLRSLLQAAGLACLRFGMTVEESLAGITREAAGALGLSEDRGRLKEGMRADLAVWDVSELAELVYWIGGPPPLLARVKGGRQDAAAPNEDRGPG